MEGLQKAYSSAVSQVQESAEKFSTYASSLEKAKPLNSSLSSSSVAALSVDQSGRLVTRSSRQFISVGTCSKLCAFCFVAGVFIGYTLKRRVKRWASRILRRLKDD
ncbi:uncharacterized protein LOC125196848 [Salvia hispanica]|uniref:uncharacterized protein LOC125196848 n=1 Tax=Salvia hispanica TaxID=49212 RepID=UPI0020090AB9|nr:uncharacterized protein LOC125196848 [Salvia hispanica]